jgi:hypothetical protein
MKVENPPIKDILDYWHSRQAESGIFIDKWQPYCWACDQIWHGIYDRKRGEYWKAWERAPLQKCHIVPKSLGGSFEPSNFVLMCKECHDLAPNTNSPEIFFEWLKNQNHVKRFHHKVIIELESFNLPEAEAEAFLTTFQTDEFKNWCIDKIGLHRPQSSYSGTGHKITVSTWIGLYKQFKNEL